MIGNYASSDRVLLGELALLGQFYEIPEYFFLRRGHPERSLEAHVTDAEIAAWFDPALKGRILLPRWRRLFEYLGAIRRVPVSLFERVRCYIQLGRFVVSPNRLGGMIEDLLKATKQVLGLLLKRRSQIANVENKIQRRVT